MKTMMVIVAVMLLCACAAYGQQTPPMYYPYQPPAQPQYAPPNPPPVQQAPVQPPQQPFSMYDYGYQGPMNVYGQPVYSAVQRRQLEQAQNQTIHNGVIPRFGRSLTGLGSYLWSYMPAPVRGVGSPYDLEPGSGQVSIGFVPGSPQ